MNCSNCSAPLRPKSNICRYCGTVNDVDLRTLPGRHEVGPRGDRPCPRCGVHMHSIDIGVDGGFLIERCKTCFGLFFDAGELEALIDASASQVVRIDHDRLATLIEEEGGTESRVKYVKCPVCQKLMNRRSYGARSGVVTDTCKEHGVWLDGGELRRIVHWSRAGGQVHDERRKDEEEKQTERRRRAAEKFEVDSSFSALPDEFGYRREFTLSDGLLGAILRLFR